MPLNSLFFVLIILFSFPSLVFADSAIDAISLNNNGIESMQRANYEEVDGTLGITIRNSENRLVGYIETTNIKVLDHAIAEKEIEQWAKKIISRNGQDFQAFQFEQKTVYEKDRVESSFRIYLPVEQVDMIIGSHYGYIIEKGDTVSIVLTIFKPIENL